MTKTQVETLLIKRYASRRLYNTESSDYVTLEDVSGFIRAGRDVQIIDLKSGDDLTRQYLLQIITDHESRGENVLPLDVLTDLVRSYTTEMQSIVPDFLAQSFEMLRSGSAAMPAIAGLEALQAQQEAFLKAMTQSMSAHWSSLSSAQTKKRERSEKGAEGLDEIKEQLAELQDKLAKMS